MCSQDLWFTDLGQILHDGYAANGYPNCRNNTIWKPLLWLASWFDGEAATMYKMWGNESQMNAQPARDILGIKFIPCKLSALDMVETLIETGYIPD